MIFSLSLDSRLHREDMANERPSSMRAIYCVERSRVSPKTCFKVRLMDFSKELTSLGCFRKSLGRNVNVSSDVDET